MNRDDKCRQCQYFTPHDKLGECRKHAPIANAEGGEALWPYLTQYDIERGCFEFKPFPE